MYHVSLAVIYTATGRMGESLYWPETDFKQKPSGEREPRAQKRRKKSKRAKEKDREKQLHK